MARLRLYEKTRHHHATRYAPSYYILRILRFMDSHDESFTQTEIAKVVSSPMYVKDAINFLCTTKILVETRRKHKHKNSYNREVKVYKFNNRYKDLMKNDVPPKNQVRE